MNKIIITLILGFAASSGLAAAASTVVVSSPIAENSRIRSTIEVLDRTSMRIHVGTAPDYLLILKDRLYSIRGKEAVDVSAMRAKIRLPSIGDEAIKMLYSLGDSGREETIAGITGKVFQISYYNTGMQFVKEELVLSPDPRVREVSQAWRVYSDVSLAGNSDSRGRDALQNYLDTYHLGVLRFGNQYQIEALGVAPETERFILPMANAAIPAAPPVLQPTP